MEKYYVLFNPIAGNHTGEAEAKKLADCDALKEAELVFCDMTQIADYSAFFAKLSEEDKIILAGGDGTLNRFVNDTDGLSIPNEIYYYATGSGNDFLHDLGKEKGSAPILITPYLQNLPTVTVQGKDYRFINGVGYGIDGYCCEVGDRLRGTTDKPINYAAIAIKGLLFHYHTTNAVVTVDGVRHSYHKVWLAPTMNGRFYGGGMMTAPQQERLGNGSVSTVLMFGSGKLKTLMVFPSIFKGEHVKHTEMVAIHTGRNITVEFDRPTALQIDGETILGVTGYTIKTGKTADTFAKV